MYWQPGNSTLVIVKPGAVERRSIGHILGRFEDAGARIHQLRMLAWWSRSTAENFYIEHQGKPFFAAHVDHMTKGAIVAAQLVGNDALVHVREMIGATDPQKAAPWTLRRLFGRELPDNAVHASDSPEAAEREIRFFFGPFEP